MNRTQLTLAEMLDLMGDVAEATGGTLDAAGQQILYTFPMPDAFVRSIARVELRFMSDAGGLSGMIPAVQVDHSPRAADPSLQMALWHRCIDVTSRAVIAEAHLRTYMLVSGEPRCTYCSGAGHTLEVHERREGKKRVREEHQRSCSVCKGTGQRTSAPPRLRRAATTTTTTTTTNNNVTPAPSAP